jgi:hypothetical protein
VSDTAYSALPDDLTIPSTLTADISQDQRESTQMIPFPFCLLFAGQSVKTITVASPSADLAAMTVDQFVRVLNSTLVSRGYPENICSWNAGECR